MRILAVLLVCTVCICVGIEEVDVREGTLDDGEVEMELLQTRHDETNQ